MIEFEEAKQIVQDALLELVNTRCSHCQCGTDPSDYISDEDVERFLRQHKLVKADTQRCCCACGTNTGEEFELTSRAHVCRLNKGG